MIGGELDQELGLAVFWAEETIALRCYRRDFRTRFPFLCGKHIVCEVLANLSAIILLDGFLALGLDRIHG